MKRTFNFISLLCVVALLTACGGRRTARDKVEGKPAIYPDYTDVTVPCNIAPLNFEVTGAEHVEAVFSADGKEVMSLRGKCLIDIPMKQWKDLTRKYVGKDLSIAVSAWTAQHPEGAAYEPFCIHIDENEIDPYVAYRLIPPGYEEWNRMGIYQRNLSTYDESAIILNSQNNGGCVNCHNFAQWNPDKIVFHARGKGGGTIVKTGENDVRKIDLTSMGPGLSGTYPSWHPSGKYIAFSANNTKQAFMVHCSNKIEVYDLKSDLIVYDVEHQDVLSDDRFLDSLNWETFPNFSPDGKNLYFCTGTAKVLPTQARDLKYSIVKVGFDEKTGKFGEQVDTVYSAARQGGSVSLPRISPDGRYMLFTWASCATFPIQHREADLRMIDLQNDSLIDISSVNSKETESYHAWSSTGKWMVFSSRRLDNRYTRLFIASFKDGKFSKPFLLPQRDPQHNDMLLYSYNIPEFVKGKVDFDKDELSEFFRVK